MIERLERLGSNGSPIALDLAVIRDDATWRDASQTIEKQI
jgi:hypothetical protein